MTIDNATINAYVGQPYGRVLAKEPDGRYSAYVLEWPGCYAEGESAEEANENLEEAMAAWVEVMLEDGGDIPTPLARDYSGRLLVRMPRSTHQALVTRAQVEGVSANHLVCGFIERGLAGSRFEPQAHRDALTAQTLLSATALAVSDSFRQEWQLADTRREAIITDDEGRWGIASSEHWEQPIGAVQRVRKVRKV